MTGLSELIRYLDRDKEILFPKLHGIGGTQKMRANYDQFLAKHSFKSNEFSLFRVIFGEKKTIFIFLWYHLFWYGLCKINGHTIIYRPNTNDSNITTSGKSIKHRLYLLLYKLSKQLRLPDLIIAQNKEIAEEWNKYKTILSHNFIISDSINPKTERRIAKKGIFVGRYSEEKEVDLTIEYAKNNSIDLTFYLSGNEKNLNYDKIIWNQKPDYSLFDYLIITSKFEGFPNVVLEARSNNLLVFGLSRIKVLNEIKILSECIFLYETIDNLFSDINSPKDYLVSNKLFLKNYLIDYKG